jgi:hypothetical protein
MLLYHILHMKGPIEREFGYIDSAFALNEANAIVNNYPLTEKSNSSGKFYKTYNCWHFHKTSQNPLISAFVRSASSSFDYLESIFKKKFSLEFVILTEVLCIGEPISLWHKDGYFFDGQLHLTILGNAGIEVEDDHGQVSNIHKNNGTLWYLNGSHYRHRVSAIQSRRLELCAPNNQLIDDIQIKKMAIIDHQLGLLDGNNKAWLELRKQQAKHVLKAIENKTASNLMVGDFSVDPRLQSKS